MQVPAIAAAPSAPQQPSSTRVSRGALQQLRLCAKAMSRDPRSAYPIGVTTAADWTGKEHRINCTLFEVQSRPSPKQLTVRGR
jgi:hypothetical protein